ncbi:MAG: Alkaline phosphatase [Acidimicrobiales bacterium]|nr:Alkaline phosphatase [Acidimicrobiales bacterium]
MASSDARGGRPRRRIRGWALLALTGLALPLAMGAPGADAAAPTGAARGALSARLATLASSPAQHQSAAAQGQAIGLPSSGPGALMHQAGNRILVNIRVATPAVITAPALAAAGASHVATAPNGIEATVAIAPDRLSDLAAVPGLQWAQEVLAPQVNRMAAPGRQVSAGGPTTSALCSNRKISQGDAQLKAALARANHGVSGAGVKIGVLSDSFGFHSAQVTSDVQNGELPGTGNPCGKTTPVSVLADTNGSDEGRAMLQIVHDLAPDAKLLFATAFLGDIDFGNQIRALRAAGATVIIDDITYYNESMYQDGVIAQAVNDVTAAGATYFSSAGNSSKFISGKNIGAYEATYRPTTCPANIPSNITSCHDFDPGAGTSSGNLVTQPGGTDLLMSVGWNEPKFGVTTDLDVFLVDSITGLVTGMSANQNTGPFDAAGFDGQAFEFVSHSQAITRSYRIVVGRRGTSGTPRFKLNFNRAPFSAMQWKDTTGGDVVGPSIYGHNASLAGASVAATPFDNANTVETFSSRGPATYCWKPSTGTTPAAHLPSCLTKQLDFSATDGVVTTLPSDSGLNPFYGTSAAAPHAGAIAALMLQKQPCAKPADVLTAERASGRHMTGFTVGDEGSGLLDADAAITKMVPCAPAAPTVDSAAPTSAHLTWNQPGSATPISGYGVQVFNKAGALVKSVGTVSTSLNVTGLTVGTVYTFKVRAISAAGNGPYSPASAAAVLPFTTLGAFTTQQFTDFAGRAPTAGELATWRSALTGAGSAAEQIRTATGFSNWGSKVDPVTRLYYAFFQRGPDTGGLDHWSASLRAGKGVGVIAQSFANSTEFKTKYGPLGNQAFVELVYHNALGRDGDSDGIAHWTEQLDTMAMTRGQVMIGFSESLEHKNRRAGEVNTVDVFYGMLRRAPNSDEIGAWMVSAKASKLPLITSLLGTPEYGARL